MVQKSLLWTTGATGDGAAAYTQTELLSWQNRGHLVDATTQGIIAGYLNSLKANTALTATPVTIDTGAAYVAGIPYLNDASVSFAVSTPVGGTTGYRLVLRADYALQTVRLVLKNSADGTAAPPAVTQTAGTTWEISLYTFTITTGGVIGSWTDTRGLIYPDGFLQFLQGSAFGTTTAAPFPKIAAPLLVQMGQTVVITGGPTAITWPVPFSSTPFVVVTTLGIPSISSSVSSGGVSTTGCNLLANTSGNINVNWIAIGPA